MVTSMSLTTTPLETQFFVLDFGGGTFAPLAGLPHVAGVGTRSEPDVVRRIVAEVTGRRRPPRGLLPRAGHRLDRDLPHAGGPQGRADDGYGDVFLVVDGWSTLRADFDDLEIELQQLAARGLTFGMHLVVAAGRWADFRAAMRDLFGTRLELRLGDPIDSEIDRKVAALVPTGRPGPRPGARQAALPRRAAAHRRRPRRRDLGDGVEDLVKRVGAAWHGPAGPEAAAAARADRPRRGPRAGRGRRLAETRLLLGINEKELAPVGLDPDREPHLLVFGDGQSGKSAAAARATSSEIMRTRTPKQAQIVVVDYRRSLLGEVPEEYLLDYLTSATQAAPALAGPRRATSSSRHPRARRHPRAAAQPLVVDRRRGLRASSTTTTWSPPSRARRCRRCSR